MKQQLAAVEIRAPRASDASAIAANLRAADRAEVAAAGLDDTEAVIREGIEHSALCWVAETEGRPLCVFGVRDWEGRGVPWLLGTAEMTHHRRAFIAMAPAYIDLMLQAFPVLINHVHADNAQAVRWLKRAGFALHPTHQHPATGEAFQMFTMESAHV